MTSSRVAGLPRERIIRCGGAPDGSDAGGHLGFDIDGHSHSASLRIDRLVHRLVAQLPARIVDLLEIAAYVYAADAAITRGGSVDRRMGAHWRRRLRFEIPIRDPDFWGSGDIGPVLAETLGLLSDDEYDFSFLPLEAPPTGERYFPFPIDEGFVADEVLLFSGGLDSLAGALNELLNRHHRIVSRRVV